MVSQVCLRPAMSSTIKFYLLFDDDGIFDLLHCAYGMCKAFNALQGHHH